MGFGYLHGSVGGEARLTRCSMEVCHPGISRGRWLSSVATTLRCSRYERRGLFLREVLAEDAIGVFV